MTPCFQSGSMVEIKQNQDRYLKNKGLKRFGGRDKFELYQDDEDEVLKEEEDNIASLIS